MPTYFVELPSPDLDIEQFTASRSTIEGNTQQIRAIYALADGHYICLLDAPSGETVRKLFDSVGIKYLRITEAAELFVEDDELPPAAAWYGG